MSPIGVNNNIFVNFYKNKYKKFTYKIQEKLLCIVDKKILIIYRLAYKYNVSAKFSIFLIIFYDKSLYFKNTRNVNFLIIFILHFKYVYTGVVYNTYISLKWDKGLKYNNNNIIVCD